MVVVPTLVGQVQHRAARPLSVVAPVDVVVRVVGRRTRGHVDHVVQRGRQHRVEAADAVSVQVAVEVVHGLLRDDRPEAGRLTVGTDQAGHAVIRLAVHADLAGRPGLRGGPLDRVHDIGLLSRPSPVEAAARPAEAAQVHHHERVAALHQPGALDEVVEAIGRTLGRADGVVGGALHRPGGTGLARVVEVRADREDHGRLRTRGKVLRPEDVRVQLDAIGRGKRGLGPLGPCGHRCRCSAGGHRREDSQDQDSRHTRSHRA